MSAFPLCLACEFGEDGQQPGVCKKAFAVHASAATIQNPAVRLRCQNFMFDLQLPFRRLTDWPIETIRDFPGRYLDDKRNVVPTPGYAPLLKDGIDFWMRNMTENGRWQSVDDVPKLRIEAVGRWRLIATCIGIAETVLPICR